MGNWFWQRMMLRRRNGTLEPDLQALQRLMTAARPVAPDLPQSDADRILAAALANIDKPARASLLSGKIGAYALAACGLFAMAWIGSSFARITNTSGRAGLAFAPSSHRPVKPVEIAGSVYGRVGNRYTGYRAALTRPPTVRPGSASNGRRHVRRACALRPHRRTMLAFGKAASQSRIAETAGHSAVVPTSLAGQNPGGTLTLVMYDAPERALRVTVSTDEVATEGYAQVSAFAPVGPGGGVLTQCTVRDEPGADGECTAMYGIAYGQPISRLADISKQAAMDAPAAERKAHP